MISAYSARRAILESAIPMIVKMTENPIGEYLDCGGFPRSILGPGNPKSSPSFMLNEMLSTALKFPFIL